MGLDPLFKVCHGAVGLLWEEHLHVLFGGVNITGSNQCLQCLLEDVFTIYCQHLCKDYVCGREGGGGRGEEGGGEGFSGKVKSFYNK